EVRIVSGIPQLLVGAPRRYHRHHPLEACASTDQGYHPPARISLDLRSNGLAIQTTLDGHIRLGLLTDRLGGIPHGLWEDLALQVRLEPVELAEELLLPGHCALDPESHQTPFCS